VLWPRTTIATAAIQNILGGDALMRASRTPEIVADAAYEVFRTPARDMTGRFLIDDSFLSERGVTDFERYRVDPSVALAQDFFVPDEPAAPAGLETLSPDATLSPRRRPGS
jgi:citronellol/citronellal dehydrogenase